MILHSLLAATLSCIPSNAYGLLEQPRHIREPATVSLRSLRDRHRPLLVFAGSDRDPKFVEQVHLLSAGTSDLHERQALFIPIVAEIAPASRASAVDPTVATVLSKEDAASARLRFHVSPAAFTVILIGKDGGEKFRSDNPVTIEGLNRIIDAMPMRQQERQDGHTE